MIGKYIVNTGKNLFSTWINYDGLHKDQSVRDFYNYHAYIYYSFFTYHFGMISLTKDKSEKESQND